MVFARYNKILLKAGLVALVAGELLFGNWIFGPQFGTLNIVRNTTRYFDVSELYSGGGVIAYRRDANGFRGVDGEVAEIDVLVIGGSTTDELYTDDSDTWSARLGRRFAAAGTPLDFANAAVSGQSVRGHNRAFEVWFPRIEDLKPRVVLAYVGYNDSTILDTEEYAEKRYDDMRSPEAARRARQFVLNNSVYYTAFRKIRGAYVRARTRKIRGTPIPPEADWRPTAAGPEVRALRQKLARRLKIYRADLKALVRRIEAVGAKPVLVTHVAGPFRKRAGGIEKFTAATESASPLPYLRLELFNEQTREVCRETVAHCVDLAQELDLDGRDFYDHIHVTPAGAAKIAELLHARLTPIIGQ